MKFVLVCLLDDLILCFCYSNPDTGNPCIKSDQTNPGPLNRGGIADLPLLRRLLAIRQKSREPNFWEVMDSFVLL